MKIYVGARFTKKEEVIKLHKILKEKGHEITCDWTTHLPISPYDKNQELA
ncbi:MAG: hypothetical protein ABIH72_05265 [archaeon]